MNETENAPADWVLLEAQNRFVWDQNSVEYLRRCYRSTTLAHAGFRALCDMIAKHEQPPVDPIIIEARAIAADARNPGYERVHTALRDSVAVKIANGEWDDHMLMRAAIRGIERGQELAKQERAK